jgi:hypothetical protein
MLKLIISSAGTGIAADKVWLSKFDDESAT